MKNNFVDVLPSYLQLMRFGVFSLVLGIDLCASIRKSCLQPVAFTKKTHSVRKHLDTTTSGVLRNSIAEGGSWVYG